MVIWTPRARADLRAIYDYIHEDSPINARGVVARMLAKTATLEKFPGKRKIVPEAKRDDIHEVSVSSWRIIYHSKNDNIHIVTIVHKRRILKDDMLEK